MGKTCAVVGRGGFALRCAELASERLRPTVLCSPDGSLAAFAAARGLPHVATPRDLAALLAETPVDFLFSVDNPFLLRSDVLRGVRERAVNYHDSLLPDLAGLNACSWSILEGRARHGITFHAIDEGIDTGAILLQREVPVEADERGSTLSAKCFETGLLAFEELVAACADGELESRSQPPGGTYRGRQDRPPAGGFLDPAMSAEDLERTVRALDLGPSPNALGAARAIVDGEVLVVRAAVIGREGGPVLETATGPLTLVALEGMDGLPVRPLAGAIVTGPAPELVDLDRRSAPHEAFWLRRWALGGFRHSMADGRSGRARRHRSPAMATALQALADRLGRGAVHAATLVVMAHARRLAVGPDPSTVAFRGPGQAAADGRAYAPWVPLGGPNLDASVAEWAEWLDRELARVEARGSLALDALRRATGRPGGLVPMGVVVRAAPGGGAAPLVLDVTGEPFLESDGACDERALETVAHHLEVFAERMARDLDQPVATLDLVPERDRALIAECRGEAIEAAPPVLDLVAQRVRERPDAIALQGSSMSYADLWERAGRIAGGLRARGVARGHRVPLRIAAPDALVVGALAVLRAGAAYVPVDGELPASRVDEILEDVRAPLVLGTGGVALDELDGVAPPLDRRPEDIFYIVFTSGSTGRPKGVRVSDGNLAAQLVARASAYPESPERVLVVHSLAFDSAAAGLWWGLTHGAAVELAPGTVRRDPAAVAERMRAWAPTHVDLPPSTHGELLARELHDAVAARVVIVGGESLPPSVAREHRRLLPGVALVNEYGPTETTIFATTHRVERDPDATVPIGRPAAGVEARIVDDRGMPLPVGIAGELWVGGPMVAAGYLDRPALERERFVEREGRRFYRTGDRVRLRRDGLLTIHGRLDSQVQVRGHRVELGEVEAVLESLEGIGRAVVSPRVRHGSVELVAHVVPRVGASIDLAELRRALAACLPPHAVPAAVARVSMLPSTPAGKVDRAALPDIEMPTGEGVPPRTPLEREVARILAEEVGLPAVGATDDFFDLGGSSLVAMRVVRRLQEELGATTRVVDVYRLRTVSALAASLERRSVPPAPSGRVIPVCSGAAGRVPLYGVHVLGEGLCFYRPLSESMGPERPVLGLASPVLPGAEDDHPTQVDELANLYLDELLRSRPQGPYYLAAVSLAGVVAWEMARLLRLRGADVRLVFFDCLGPEASPGTLERVQAHIDELRRHGLDHVRSRLRRRADLVRDRFEELWASTGKWLGRELDHHDRVQLVMRRNHEAAMAYTIEPVDVPIVLYRATQEVYYGQAYREAALGWAPFAREVEVVDVPGRHTGILEPPAVEIVARDLARRLQGDDRSPTGPPVTPHVTGS